ncbi:MAG: hypothetical protein NZ901_11950 [Geminocystis sp.]|nr:hypothetical protein [Geminocystis sp.]HIK37483.1 hypothetical protein [Geminocystis sp. M7585_C2015_104]MCS7148883.1 hypothetical protein [Geminocystis sp.]MCX8078653.1 hypothetical protein [Geminocystis sp.]MDW8116968.1 hypothetical protein [Geminocystis sp.]
MIFWEEWLNQHPIVSFFLSHPVMGIILLIILVYLISYLLQQIPRIIINLLWRIIKLPFWLLGLYFDGEKGDKQVVERIGEISAKEEIQGELMKTIIKKLEDIEEKQTKILEALLKEKK